MPSLSEYQIYAKLQSGEMRTKVIGRLTGYDQADYVFYYVNEVLNDYEEKNLNSIKPISMPVNPFKDPDIDGDGIVTSKERRIVYVAGIAYAFLSLVLTACSIFIPFLV